MNKRHEHHSIARRRKSQAVQLEAHGKDPTQPADMLEFYLLGESVAQIAAAYHCSVGSVYRIICKEALYQLMEQRAVDRLEEMDELL